MHREPLLRADIRDPIPAYDAKPASCTGRVRAHLLTDPAELDRAKQLQLEYHQRAAEADVAPRNE